MKRLPKKPKIYLAGAMEKADDGELGTKWRDLITPTLENLGFEVWNPVEFEADQLRGLHPNRLPKEATDLITEKKFIPKHWHDLKRAKESNLYNRFLKYMRRIREYDLGLVEHKMDYLFVLWDEGTLKGAGTHAEIEMAHKVNIPVYCVTKAELPAWLHPAVDEKFSSIEEALLFLSKEFS